MLIGCLVLGAALAAAVYPMTYAFVKWYRRGGAGLGPDVPDDSAAAPCVCITQVGSPPPLPPLPPLPVIAKALARSIAAGELFAARLGLYLAAS